jgi:hypothetical protein
MVKAKVGILLSTPFADLQAWTRGLEPTNGGTMFHPRQSVRPGGGFWQDGVDLIQMAWTYLLAIIDLSTAHRAAWKNILKP